MSATNKDAIIDYIRQAIVICTIMDDSVTTDITMRDTSSSPDLTAVEPRSKPKSPASLDPKASLPPYFRAKLASKQFTAATKTAATSIVKIAFARAKYDQRLEEIKSIKVDGSESLPPHLETAKTKFMTDSFKSQEELASTQAAAAGNEFVKSLVFAQQATIEMRASKITTATQDIFDDFIKRHGLSEALVAIDQAPGHVPPSLQHWKHIISLELRTSIHETFLNYWDTSTRNEEKKEERKKIFQERKEKEDAELQALNVADLAKQIRDLTLEVKRLSKNGKGASKGRKTPTKKATIAPTPGPSNKTSAKKNRDQALRPDHKNKSRKRGRSETPRPKTDKKKEKRD